MHITILGSGNVASHLQQAFRHAGHEVTHLSAREFVEHGVILDASTDAIVISVKDDAIAEVARKIGDVDTLVVHTAGSIAMDVLPQRHRGVLYPMQTFTKDVPLEYSEIPFFLEAPDAESMALLTSLATSVSPHVVPMNSNSRAKMHLAAVFAANMANHCYALAEQIVNEEGIDFSLFGPLIKETARKASVLSPRKAQTGPMVRQDYSVMNKQLTMINNPLAKELYMLFAKSIKNL